MKRRRRIVLVVVAMVCSIGAQGQPYPTKLLEHEQQIDNIIRSMTLEEKIDMLHGKNMFSSAGIPRQGIADMEYADGPFGIREEMEPHSWNSAHLTTDSATFFPTGSAQEDGTAVCLKHYALNNQEDYRGFVDVHISDRAMHEIYLRPFEMAVREADAWGVMAAYNKVNGRWCSENEPLLTTILRRQWGFPGMVISDWGGVHSMVDAVTAGMNVEMPGNRFFGQALLDSVKAGKVSEDVINQRVREILRVRLTVKPVASEEANKKPVGNDDEMLTALQVARRSIVLLKNEPIVGKHALKSVKNRPWPLLPINLTSVKRIAVIGENAVTKMALGGVGAGVKTRKEITPLEGLQAVLGGGKKITYAPGYKSFDRDSRNKRQSPQQPADPALMAEAVKVAQDADLVIFFAGDNREVETEGSDRKSITLPSGQDELAQALAKANPRLVTVIVAGGPVDVTTVSAVSPVLIVSWFNGSMGGQAIAEVLTGDVSPSGKLPMTWPKKLEDVPAYATGSFPQQVNNDNQGDIFVGLTRNQSNDRRQQLVANYAEESLVGYRWYDAKKVAVAYPFGYGLSYAQFQYSAISVKPTTEGFDVNFTLANTSGVDAEEVVQVYVSRPLSHIERPEKELKAFKRVVLKGGESQKVTVPVRRTDLCHWDEAAQTWMLEPGTITLKVGGSSDNLPLSAEVVI